MVPDIFGLNLAESQVFFPFVKGSMDPTSNGFLLRDPSIPKELDQLSCEREPSVAKFAIMPTFLGTFPNH